MFEKNLSLYFGVSSSVSSFVTALVRLLQANFFQNQMIGSKVGAM